MRKKKAKIVVNNKIKAFGQTDSKTNLVEINRKKHKGNRRELADTVKHELLHVKHPKAKEKTIRKMTEPELSPDEQNKLIAKIRMKKINYRRGALKRKFKLTPKDSVEPGDFIKKANEDKLSRLERVAISGLV